MTLCKELTKELLTNPIDLLVDDPNLDLGRARSIADEKAVELASAPMLLGWYDKTTGQFSPNVECCSEKKPGWLVYAESRGGNITININNETFIFVYADIGLAPGDINLPPDQ